MSASVGTAVDIRPFHVEIPDEQLACWIHRLP